VGGAIYFVTFIIINGIILFNVVVAVLLDKCINSGDGSAAESDTNPKLEPLEKRLKQEGAAFESSLSKGVRRDKSMAIMPLRRGVTMGVTPLASNPQRGKVPGVGAGTASLRVAGSGKATCNLWSGEISFANQAAPSNDVDEGVLSGLCSSMSMLNKQMAIIVAAINDNQMQLDLLESASASSTTTRKVSQ
jgi:hypothetical protein